MLDRKKIIRTIMTIIIIYTVIGIILPFVFKFVIFESTEFSNLTNNEWAGFLGSYVGGILGGLGTLISVFITVKESRDMQIENKKDTDQKILEDKAEREMQRKEDKILEAQREKRQFVDDIAVYIGKYITHISKYYYTSRWAENLNSSFYTARDNLRRAENKLIVLDDKISKLTSESDEYDQLKDERGRLIDQKDILEREYNEKLNEKEKNSIEGNRTEANECFFILKTKLHNIAEANELLSQLNVLQKDMFGFLHETDYDWLGENTDLLMEKYSQFKLHYSK